MKKILMFAFMVLLIGTASAEMSLWNSVIKDNSTSIVKHHVYYWFDDTSDNKLGVSKAVPIYLSYQVQALPYNLTYGQVDWCNLTISHFVNQWIFSTLNLPFINESHTDYSSYYFDSGSYSGILEFDMKADDVLIADMSCHYTDINSLYEQNLLVGSLTTFVPTFECDECSKYTLEELSGQISLEENSTNSSLDIYSTIQKGVSWNYTIWLIISWVVKIGLVFVGMFFIFSGVYYLYTFLNNLAREI